MSKAGFTEGSWEFAHAGQGSFGGKFVITEYFVRRPDDDVAIASDVIDPVSGAPSEANARLMAAAPELLEALSYAMQCIAASLEFHLGNPGFEQAEAMGKAAIAKATGTTHG